MEKRSEISLADRYDVCIHKVFAKELLANEGRYQKQTTSQIERAKAAEMSGSLEREIGEKKNSHYVYLSRSILRVCTPGNIHDTQITALASKLHKQTPRDLE